MNIFALDLDPVACAQAHCDKHVVKMVLESAQLLSTTHHRCNSPVKHRLYLPTHANHPCQLWLLESASNYYWLSRLAVALCDEYEHRYGREHASRLLIETELTACPHSRTNRVTPFALAMPAECKPVSPYYSLEEAVEAYRLYYAVHKAPILTYTNRKEPEWLTL